MTNADYIKSKLSDVDIAWMLRNGGRFAYTKSSLIERAYKAWTQWAESASNNHGNMAKGKHGETEIKEDPSVWYWPKWKYPDGTWKNSGRTQIVSLQVWLSMQYRPEEWMEVTARIYKR